MKQQIKEAKLKIKHLKIHLEKIQNRINSITDYDNSYPLYVQEKLPSLYDMHTYLEIQIHLEEINILKLRNNRIKSLFN